jgi:hypothetical protein
MSTIEDIYMQLWMVAIALPGNDTQTPSTVSHLAVKHSSMDEASIPLS